MVSLQVFLSPCAWLCLQLKWSLLLESVLGPETTESPAEPAFTASVSWRAWLPRENKEFTAREKMKYIRWEQFADPLALM